MLNNTKTQHLILSLVALAAGAARAADPPPLDAGTLLRQQPSKPPITQRPAREAVAADPAAPGARDEGPRLLVKVFRFEGASLIPEAELQQLVAADVGKSMSLRQLQAIGSGVSVYYAARGYLARVLVQPQKAADGVVVLQIVEGRLGAFNVNPRGERVQPARAQAFLSERLQAGQPLSLKALGEAVGLLNEQPGVLAQSALKPGAGEGTVDVLVDLSDKPLLAGRVQTDNTGSRATGALQASASVALLNPTGLFDAATLLLNASHGLKYASADYSLAVGNRGLRMGASASYLDYKSVQPSLAALDPNGRAWTAGAYASYPLKAMSHDSLRLNGGLDYRVLRDHAGPFELSHRRVGAASLGLVGWQAQQWLSPGVTQFSLQATVGKVGLSRNPASAAADAVTRRTAGRYVKLSASMDRQSPLGGNWELQASLRAQVANGNLDSSERFGLGGPGGVRAYPVGEASGDQGWLLKLNAVRPLGERQLGRLFLDYGRVSVNKKTWTGWEDSQPGVKNSYGLAGIGAGIDWALPRNLNLSLAVAAPLGSNPGRSAVDGRDADGRKPAARAWINLQGSF